MRQDTEEWHEFRRRHVGASDAPIIMGVSPWRTLKELWEEKVTGISNYKENFAMTRGKELEPEARKLYEFLTDRCVNPEVLEHPQYKFLSASFDGLSPFGNFACEIKISGKKDHQKALDGEIPEKYYPQLQHQIFVANLEEIDYFSWNEDSHALITVKRDQQYIVKMVEKELEFWSYVQSKHFPEYIL